MWEGKLFKETGEEIPEPEGEEPKKNEDAAGDFDLCSDSESEGVEDSGEEGKTVKLHAGASPAAAAAAAAAGDDSLEEIVLSRRGQ